jgi:glycosyltransferase involved in cell wall biosynthesis
MQTNINLGKASDNILDSIKINPYDSCLNSVFNKLYVMPKEKDPRFHEVSCKLNYLNNPNNYNYLNELGNYYLEGKNSFLSLLCYLESLRINPKQVEIFSILPSIENSCKPLNLGYFHNPEKIVSVIMATYKRNGAIKESIQSVLNQTVRDLELIVINDGEENDEHTRQIIMGFNSSRIKYYKLNSNSGHARAMNEGIQRARGKYIAYLDDDDIYYPMHLETLVNGLERSGHKFAYANTQIMRGKEINETFIPTQIVETWDVDFDREALLKKNYISNLSIIHARDILSFTGCYYNDLRVVMDWEMWLRASLKYDFLHIKQCTGEYRLRDDSITIKDRLSIEINTILIRKYYTYYNGLIAYVKHYLFNKMEENAREVYAQIIDQYGRYFKTVESFAELIPVSSYFGDVKFINNLFPHYFALGARDCLNYIFRNKSFGMFCSVLPLLSKKILTVVKRTIQSSRISRV